MTAPSSLSSIGLLLLRIWASGMMIYAHGLGKLASYSERAPKFSDPIGLGPSVSFTLVTFAEFFCALFVAIGLATRFAAIPLVIAMSVAGFIVHAADPFMKKELAFLYLCVYLSIALMGPGRYSIDHQLRKKGVRFWA